MNIAMIMCHKNPSQVIRLVRKISTSFTDVVIHADSNMSESDMAKLRSFSEKSDGVYIASKRYHGVLDRRVLVDIVLAMIEKAKEVEKTEQKHYQYYVLLSGQDYPIIDIKQIESNLHESYPQPYIDVTPYDRTNWVFNKFSMNQGAFFFHTYIRDNMKGIPRKIARVVAIGYQMVTDLLKKHPYKKLNQLGVELYGGSAWWILPDKVIDYIMDEVSADKEYISVLLNDTITPEETFFQIMAMRSTLKDMIVPNPVDMVLQNCKTYAYFFSDSKEFMGHPHVFTMDDTKLLAKKVEEGFWFARKFDSTIDDDILDYLDAH